jgi:hypothetical protein
MFVTGSDYVRYRVRLCSLQGQTMFVTRSDYVCYRIRLCSLQGQTMFVTGSDLVRYRVRLDEFKTKQAGAELYQAGLNSLIKTKWLYKRSPAGTGWLELSLAVLFLHVVQPICNVLQPICNVV